MRPLSFDSKIILNNGVLMPVLGLGTHKAKEGDEVENAVVWALQAGYRLIDTARIYGNEGGVGKAIKNSGIERGEIFVTTKLWNEDQGYESALKAIDASLMRLGMEYVDLYLVHWPAADEEGKINKREETWKAMEEILASGKARAIGVSNYTIGHLQEMKKYAKVLPAVNQVEFHPFLLQKDLLEYCAKEGIVLEAWSPLTKARRLADPRIGVIATKYGKSNAQLLIRWSLQHGLVVIPKSVHQERIIENAHVFDFEITPEDMTALDALNESAHGGWDPTSIS